MSVALADIETEEKPDSELVQACLNGDQHSFRLLYRRYQHKVRSTLYQLCGSTILDDLVQEVFLRAWKGLPKLRQVNNFSSWLYRICWNVATDQRRKFAQQRTCDLQLNTHAPQCYEDSNLMQLHYQDTIKRALAQLSLEQRYVLILHDLQDVPQKEVAQILGVPVGTVKSRLFHARAAIRQFLQQQGVEL